MLVPDQPSQNKPDHPRKINPFHTLEEDPYRNCETPDERAAREAAEGRYDWDGEDATFDSDFAGFTRHAQK